jgi:hypothetical protein
VGFSAAMVAIEAMAMPQKTQRAAMGIAMTGMREAFIIIRHPF